MFYLFKFSDFEKVDHEREPFEPYQLESIKRNVSLIPFATKEELEKYLWVTRDVWCVYSEDGYSYEPVDCASQDEAYEHLTITHNISLYERMHDL